MKTKWLLLILTFSMHGASAQRDELIEEARSLYARGNYQATLVKLAELGVSRFDGNIFLMRADCFHKLDQFSEALENYDLARLHGCTSDELMLNRGICKVSLGLYDNARFDLISYIQKHPEDVRAYYWMAALEYMCVELKAAMSYINQTIEMDSTYAEAYYLRGACYAGMNRKMLALDDFHSAYTMNASLDRAKLNMALMHMDMGQFEQAAEMLSELSVQNIDFTAEVLYYRGESLFAMHDADGACKDWNDAATLGDADALAAFRKVCLDRKGKPRLKRRMYVQF